MDVDKATGCVSKFFVNLFHLSFEPGFYLKVIAFFLTIVTSLFWRIPDAGYSGMDGHLEELVFSHTVPGYFTVMFGLVVIYILGDRPHKWFYYVFYGTGIVLLLLVGFLGVYNCMFQPNDWGSPPLFMAYSNILTAVVMTCDLLYSTALFGVCAIVKERIDQGLKGDDQSEQEDGDKRDEESDK